MKILPLKDIDVGKVSFRFWRKTKQVGQCLEWQAGCDSEGYGKFSIFHRSLRSHRVAYFLYYGIDPGDRLVRQRCDNPKCVNPTHLAVGTQKSNIADMDSRGRRTNVYLKGERSGRAILSEADVLAIRASTKSNAELACEYSVSKGCIAHARNGTNWKHLNDTT